LYYTASGIITPVGGRPVHRLREDSQEGNKEGNKVMFLSEWREFPSAPCLAGKKT